MKRTKQIIIGCLTLGMVVLGGTASAFADDRIHYRSRRQVDRIYNGVRNGEISQDEFRRLGRQQMRIRQFKKRATADGHLSAHERKRLRKMQNRASRTIYKAKHDRDGYGRHRDRDRYERYNDRYDRDYDGRGHGRARSY